MKKAIKTLWEGLKTVFSVIVDWVATLFGMKDNSKFGRVLRRIVGACFALMVGFYVTMGFVSLCESLGWNLFDSDENAYVSEFLSKDLAFYGYYSGKEGYVADGNGEKILKHVQWVAAPEEGDSLVCYSDGEHRGYFHLRDGKVVIEPTYKHAWIFSEGLAAVEENGCIKFIDTKGRVTIDKDFVYNDRNDGYVFHQGHCVMTDTTGNMGLIDRKGNWVLSPEYDDIRYSAPSGRATSPSSSDERLSFWIIESGEQQAVLTFDLDTVIPMTDASFQFGDTAILATFADHTQGIYSFQGKLIADNQIRSVEQLMYETHEVMYPTQTSGDEIYSSDESYIRKAVATCYKYEADWSWYGLMSPDGHIVTLPSYVNIEAVDKDLYLCQTAYGYGILLDSKGRRVD